MLRPVTPFRLSSVLCAAHVCCALAAAAAPADSSPAGDDASKVEATATPPPERPIHDSTFSFGSYGRVNVASDLAGHPGRSTDLVRYGSRVDESSYAELQLVRGDRFGDAHTSVVFTLALLGPFFHFDGLGSDTLAVRQLFLETRHALLPDLALWAGSRIVRGDDVFLLDFWPLDNLNLMGGGARYVLGEKVELAAHVGLHRLQDQYQYQVIDVPARFGLGTDSVALLDRPRTVGAMKATYWPLGRNAAKGLKVIGYGELHDLPAGERETTTGSVETLPADRGTVVGAQVGAWHGPSHSFANAFVRYARGLAAWNPLESPFAAGQTVTTTERASEFVAALVGNGEHGAFGLQLGAYFRSFRDAAPSPYDRGATHEVMISARPHWWFSQWGGLALEASWQNLSLASVDDVSGQALRGSLGRFAVMPYVTPAGPGSYTRPHLRLIYAVTIRDAGATNMFAVEDTRSRQPVEHFLGLGAEWWFDSSYR